MLLAQKEKRQAANAPVKKMTSAKLLCVYVHTCQGNDLLDAKPLCWGYVNGHDLQ